MGRTCYARSDSEQDGRHKAGRRRHGGRAARWRALGRGGASTPCPTRGPPLSGFWNGKGGVPQESSLVIPKPEACGDTAGIPLWVGAGASPRERGLLLPYRWHKIGAKAENLVAALAAEFLPCLAQQQHPPSHRIYCGRKRGRRGCKGFLVFCGLLKSKPTQKPKARIGKWQQ